MTRKLISMFLIILMLLSLCAVSFVSASADVSGLPEVKEGCNRYFFLQPREWSNEYTDTIGIYWWEGTGAASSWPGYEACNADIPNVYYYDVPKDVTTIIWNNYVDLLLEEYDERSFANEQTVNLSTEGYAPDENELYPEGISSFDGMIFVIDPDKTSTSVTAGKTSWEGDWYNYYGNGEYGTTSTQSNELPKLQDGFNRYFFYLPQSWERNSSDVLKVYYEAFDLNLISLAKADFQGVYYCDISEDIDEFYFVKGDEFKAFSTSPKPLAPEFDLQSCNGKIFIIDFSYTVTSVFDGKDINHGLWFYYYGDGEYGDTAIRGVSEIYTDRAFNEPALPSFYLVGDANCDDVVNIKDATAIQKHIAKIETCDSKAGNVDFMSGLNIKDATAIQKHIAGIETGFIIGTYAS